MNSDERFFAWLDGELEGPEATEMAARVAADPELGRRADDHRAMRAKLSGAFDTLLIAPAPERLAAAARRPEPKVADLAAARRDRQARRWTPIMQWGSMAATLALGVLIGTAVPQRSASPVEVEGGKVLAAPPLHDALETQLASAPKQGEVQIPLTFRDRSGAICRSFVVPGASGLACRTGDQWQVRGLVTAPEGQASEYRMAAGTDPQLMSLIEGAIAGAPFDAEAEQAAKSRGWK